MSNLETFLGIIHGTDKSDTRKREMRTTLINEFKEELIKLNKRDYTFAQAVDRWVREGYADAFEKLYRPHSTIDNIRGALNYD